eukprot:14250626-Alexandrium_andersonii.AAC.1
MLLETPGSVFALRRLPSAAARPKPRPSRQQVPTRPTGETTISSAHDESQSAQASVTTARGAVLRT